MPAIGTVDRSTTTLSTSDFTVIRDNTDIQPIRMKGLHVDMVVSPNSGATKPISIRFHLHRVHNNVANANLSYAEGTRVKHEVITVGQLTDRYYRMYLKEINIEFGYHLVFVATPVDIAGGTPTFAMVGKWWEIAADSP